MKSDREAAPKLIILRGIPGSGKSTYARGLSAAVFSSDDYGGSPGERKAALIRALCGTLPFVELDVVVDDCHLDALACAPYVALGRAYGFKVEIHTLTRDVSEAARARPQVSKAAMHKMAAKLEAATQDWPSGWPRPTNV